MVLRLSFLSYPGVKGINSVDFDIEADHDGDLSLLPPASASVSEMI